MFVFVYQMLLGHSCTKVHFNPSNACFTRIFNISINIDSCTDLYSEATD